jgi:hypothetical protein
MESIKELIENYYNNSEIPDYKIISDDEIIIEDKYGINLSLNKTEILQIRNGKKINNPHLEYLNDFGILANNYVELFVEAVDESLSALLIFGNEELDLTFQIEEVEINISRVSNFLSFVLNKFYSERYYHIRDRGLQENYYSLKLNNIKKDNFKKYAQEALYYINSEYIRKVISPLKFYKLDSDYLDPVLSEESNDIEIEISSVNRIRIRRRASFENLELIQFYNYSQTLDRYEKFINIYRIIEYYYPVARNRYLNKYRNDPKISNDTLIKVFDRESELKNLSFILDILLTEAEKKHVIELYLNKKFIQDKKLESFAASLYQYRMQLFMQSQHRSIIL